MENFKVKAQSSGIATEGLHCALHRASNLRGLSEPDQENYKLNYWKILPSSEYK